MHDGQSSGARFPSVHSDCRRENPSIPHDHKYSTKAGCTVPSCLSEPYSVTESSSTRACLERVNPAHTWVEMVHPYACVDSAAEAMHSAYLERDCHPQPTASDPPSELFNEFAEPVPK